MKLRKEFITMQTGDTQIMVSTDTKLFSGLVRSNATTAFVIEKLKNETSFEEILNAMKEEYEGDPEVMARDLKMVLDKLRSIKALEE